MEEGGQCRDPTTYPRERDKAPILQEAEWALVLVWKGVENLSLTTNPSSDCQARSKSL